MTVDQSCCMQKAAYVPRSIDSGCVGGNWEGTEIKLDASVPLLLYQPPPSYELFEVIP